MSPSAKIYPMKPAARDETGRTISTLRDETRGTQDQGASVQGPFCVTGSGHRFTILGGLLTVEDGNGVRVLGPITPVGPTWPEAFSLTTDDGHELVGAVSNLIAALCLPESK